jgi:hypothetical protein
MKTNKKQIWGGCGAIMLCALLFSGWVINGSAQDAEPETNQQADTNAPVAAPTTEETQQSGMVQTLVRHGYRDSSGQEIVVFGQSAELAEGESIRDMVAIFGSATVRGNVRDQVVAIFGNILIEGETRDAVAVFGNIKLGSNAVVSGDAVTVFGNVAMGPSAKIKGDVVAVGGAVDRAEGATIGGQIMSFPGFGWVGDWVEHCLLKLRPLAPRIGWLWVLPGAFFLLYLLVALALPRPVNACLEEITRRPATTLMIGLLTKILLPFVIFILLATGIGVFVVPFLLAALFFAAILGKVALLQYVGRQLGRQFGGGALETPLLAFVVGWVLITLLYFVPVLGLVVFGVTGIWALGAAVMAMFGGTRREIPPRTAPDLSPTGTGQTPPPVETGVAAFAVGTPSNTTAEPGATPVSGSAETETPPPPPAPMPVPPSAPANNPEALTNPRANFWERMGAAFLDVILVAILSSVVGGAPLGFLVALAYFAGMWAWKGTTVGGIVLNLKVVRLDNQPVTFPVALVRGLAAAFSVVVLFLGFLWMIWDRDKQTWHDKIAGTVVIRLPRGTPLVCF